LESLIKTAANELGINDTSRIAYKELFGQVSILIYLNIHMFLFYLLKFVVNNQGRGRKIWSIYDYV